MRGWQGQPRKMVEYEHWQKIKPDIRSWPLGCGLQFGDAGNDLLAGIGLQSSNTLFSAARTRTSNSRCLVLWSKDAMRVILF
jgi:hypothetical protein